MGGSSSAERIRRSVGAGLVLALALLFPAPATAALSPQERAVLAAREAFQAGDAVQLARQADQAAGHPLSVYIDFWRLRLRLVQAETAEVRQWLDRTGDTPLAEELRREWLCHLARSGRWALFLEERSALRRETPEMAAWALQARWRIDGGVTPAEIRPFWTAPSPLPEGLLPVVEDWLAAGRLTERDLRERFRILVGAGLLVEAGQVAERLPAAARPPAARLEQALRQPAAFLKAPVALAAEADRQLAMAAVLRLAREDPPAAAAWWGAVPAGAFPEAESQALWGVLAERGARRHLPDALGWFRRAGGTPLTEEQLAWWVRIALRQGRWTDVLEAVGRMGAAGAADPAWVYWRGRALLATGAREEGLACLERIAGQHHFYGLLAAEELGRPLVIPPAATPTAAELAGVESQPGIRRALALYRIGLRSEGQREWLWAVRAMDDRSLLAAAELARRQGIWDRAINTADRTVAVHDFTLRYLAPQREILARHARQQKLEEPLVLGLVRRESRFLEDARSRAGASGLMQLMPDTARWVARRIGMKGFSPARVNRPEVNAALGTAYLRHVLDRLGSTVLAAAAYNAGPRRAVQWQGAGPLEGAIYVESIPFPETRQYVKKVLTNARYYEALATGGGRGLRDRLGTVAAAANGKNGGNGLEETP